MTAAGDAPPRGGQSTLLSQSSWNLLGLVCMLAANFVTVPFVVRWIGLANFGRAGLVLAIAAPLTLVGTVIGQAIVREVSTHEGTGEVDAARRTFNIALRFGFLSSVMTGLGLALVGPLLAGWLGGPQAPDAELESAFGLAGIGLFAQQMSLILQGYAMARQDFRRIAQLAALGGAATLGLCLTFAAAVPDERGYLAGVSAAFVATLLGWSWAYRRNMSFGRLAGGAGLNEARGLIQFGKWQGLAQVAGALGNQVDRYALSALAPIAVVGQYNVANRLQEAVYLSVMKAGEVLFPYFGKVSQTPEARRQWVFQLGSWVLITFSAAVLVPMVPLAEAILGLWVGPSVGPETATLLRTLVVGGLVGCGSNVFTYYAMGLGQNAAVAWMSIAYSLATVVCTIILISLFGPLAAGAGLLIASVGRVAFALTFARRYFFTSMAWQDLFSSTVAPIAVGLGIAWAFYMSGPWPIGTWLALTAAYAALAATVLAAILTATLVLPGGRAFVASARTELRRSGR